MASSQTRIEEEVTGFSPARSETRPVRKRRRLTKLLLLVLAALWPIPRLIFSPRARQGCAALIPAKSPGSRPGCGVLITTNGNSDSTIK